MYYHHGVVHYTYWHDVVMTWKHFLNYWPLLANPLVTNSFPSQRANNAKFWCFHSGSVDKLLNKQPRHHWFQMPWHPYDVTVMKLWNSVKLEKKSQSNDIIPGFTCKEVIRNNRLSNFPMFCCCRCIVVLSKGFSSHCSPPTPPYQSCGGHASPISVTI